MITVARYRSEYVCGIVVYFICYFARSSWDVRVEYESLPLGNAIVGNRITLGPGSRRLSECTYSMHSMHKQDLYCIVNPALHFTL